MKIAFHVYLCDMTPCIPFQNNVVRRDFMNYTLFVLSTCKNAQSVIYLIV